MIDCDRLVILRRTFSLFVSPLQCQRRLTMWGKSGFPRFGIIVQERRVSWSEPRWIWGKTALQLTNWPEANRKWFKWIRLTDWPENWVLSSMSSVRPWPKRVSKMSLMKLYWRPWILQRLPNWVGNVFSCSEWVWIQEVIKILKEKLTTRNDKERKSQTSQAQF